VRLCLHVRLCPLVCVVGCTVLFVGGRSLIVRCICDGGSGMRGGGIRVSILYVGDEMD